MGMLSFKDFEHQSVNTGVVFFLSRSAFVDAFFKFYTKRSKNDILDTVIYEIKISSQGILHKQYITDKIR